MGRSPSTYCAVFHVPRGFLDETSNFSLQNFFARRRLEVRWAAGHNGSKRPNWGVYLLWRRREFGGYPLQTSCSGDRLLRVRLYWIAIRPGRAEPAGKTAAGCFRAQPGQILPEAKSARTLLWSNDSKNPLPAFLAPYVFAFRRYREKRVLAISKKKNSATSRNRPRDIK